MQYRQLLFCLTLFFLSSAVKGQQPRYTAKVPLAVVDTTVFKPVHVKNGLNRTYAKSKRLEIVDLDDDSTTFVVTVAPAMLFFEGPVTNGKRNGVFTVSIIDSADHTKRYKIYEQTYKDDKLDGLWRTFSLRGTLVNTKNFKADSLNGVSTEYWIDGKSIMSQTDYFGGTKKFIERDMYKSGKVETEVPYENGKKNGLAKKYYESGGVQEEDPFINDELNGIAKKYYENGSIQSISRLKDNGLTDTLRYYYPNGQVWIEEIFKNGKNWAVVGNYTSDGKKRDGGTLYNGNGTLILYNDDGTVRAVETYFNGNEVK